MRTVGSLVLVSLAVLAASLATAAPQARQSAPPAQAASAQRGPDLLGLYPGMPAAEARRRLQAHSDAARVQDIVPNSPEYGFSLKIIGSGGSGNDNITVYITLPPSPPVVWVISREASFAAMYGRLDNLVAKSTLLTTLREKYGKETTFQEFGPTSTTYWWVFDQSGQRVATADLRMLVSCGWQRYQIMPMTTTLPPPQPCVSSYYALRVNLHLSYGPEVVDAFEATLVNLPLGYQAGMATMNAKNAAAEAARKQELEKARKKKPVF